MSEEGVALHTADDHHNQQSSSGHDGSPDHHEPASAEQMNPDEPTSGGYDDIDVSFPQNSSNRPPRRNMSSRADRSNEAALRRARTEGLQAGARALRRAELEREEARQAASEAAAAAEQIRRNHARHGNEWKVTFKSAYKHFVQLREEASRQRQAAQAAQAEVARLQQELHDRPDHPDARHVVTDADAAEINRLVDRLCSEARGEEEVCNELERLFIAQRARG